MEESKSQKVRLRGLYDAIVDFFQGKGEEMNNKADWWQNKREEYLEFI